MTTFRDRAQPHCFNLERYRHLEWLDGPQVSPDGAWVAYTVTAFDEFETWQTSLWLVSTTNPNPERIGSGSSPRWSPDGSRLVFVSDDDQQRSQIFELNLHLRQQRALTALEHAPSAPEWSPDGQHLVFCVFVPNPDEWGIEPPPSPANASRPATPFITTQLHYKQEPSGLQPDGFEHVFVLELTELTLRQLTFGSWRVGARESGRVNAFGTDHHSGSPQWSADGQHLYFDGDLSPDAELHHLETTIHRVDVSTGIVETLLRAPVGQRTAWYDPRPSPDGRFVACLGYTWSELHHFRSHHIWVLDLQTWQLRDLTPQLDSVPQHLRWHDQALYFNLPERGREHLCALTLDGQLRRIYENRDEHFDLGSLSVSGLVAGVLASARHPGDIAVLDLHDPVPTRLTQSNRAMLQGVTFGPRIELEYPSSDGTPIKGSLILPPEGGHAGAAPPLLVRPSAAGTWPQFDFELEHFAANGYAVFTCHHRLNQTSVGFGEAYTNNGFNGFPNQRVYDDILCGVQVLLERGLIDPTQQFVVGSSQGGTVTTGLLETTAQFRAAAVLRPGWIEPISGILTTDETAWAFGVYQTPFWQNPSAWLEHSLILRADRISTPTLLMTGEADWRTPMNQTEQLYAALKLINRTATRLIRMPGVSHGWGDDFITFARLQLYVLKWFDQWAQETS
jgi:dipeptidyl aminopeptidase/acylaminoacyl peptidase